MQIWQVSHAISKDLPANDEWVDEKDSSLHVMGMCRVGRVSENSLETRVLSGTDQNPCRLLRRFGLVDFRRVSE